MSDDQTQAPSNRRRQQARERGMVAHSPELTATAGLLTALGGLWLWGPHLIGALDQVLRSGFEQSLVLGGELTVRGASDALRQAAFTLIVPVTGIAGFVVLAMLVVHQSQLGGFWQPGLLAPDPTRLVAGLRWGGHGPARFLVAVTRSAALAGLTFWILAAAREPLQALGAGSPAAVGSGSARWLLAQLAKLAGAVLVAGVLDWALRRRQLEAQLRMSPEEQRQDLREAEGDHVQRARRRQVARSWRQDPAEGLVQGAWVLAAGANLAVVVLPATDTERLTVKRIARGLAARRLLQGAHDLGYPVHQAPAAARHLARGRRAGPLPRDAFAELDALGTHPANPAATPSKPPVRS